MHVLNDLLIVFALAVAVSLICHRLKLPSVVGFILTGTLAGPHGLGLVHSGEDVEFLAELGVVLLLFSIGLEFSLSELLRIKRIVFLGGGLQVALTIAAVWGISARLVPDGKTALALGFLLALSSTAIVLKVLQDRMELEGVHGQMSLGILLFQDVAVVPMMLFIPLLAGREADAVQAGGLLLVKSLGILALVFAGQRWILPRILDRVATTRSREIFLLTSVLICFGVAWITSSAGLSLSLGAFLAGLILSETEYSHQTLANMLPFKDLFTSLFFISIGMILDVSYIAHNLAAVTALTLGSIALKAMICALVVILLGYPIRAALMCGLVLAQIGEFSFVLCKVCISNGLLAGEQATLFLSVSTLTMLAAPLLIAMAPGWADRAEKLPWPRRIREGMFATVAGNSQEKAPRLANHLVIVGYGPVGRTLARAARMGDIPYCIIEMNPTTVQQEKRKGETIFFGDASQPSILEHAQVARARVVVVSLADPPTVRRITAAVKAAAPTVHLIARTRFISEMDSLVGLGADEVVPEELETSIELFSRILSKYLIPKEDIERLVDDIRAEGYKALSAHRIPTLSWCDIVGALPDVEVRALRISPSAPVVGRTIGELGLRKKMGITILAVRRDGALLPNPGPELALQAGDHTIVLGTPDQLRRAHALLTQTS
ncbi:monovalent cation:H+ antiporter-2, CPA2 family [Desulfacinum infernum DSM 9756]|uniref:Monovalent cation:H+ antiporter-2, CPA2 family n=1 Tax=Desulfacinum infernum DSM 9756 TaxID=1121391 RepID=A0A1M5D756_9BACT|nr:cation:proton antiporter [Desulfacinum infernum]SHF62512.1 monovalent cation:H+ antiporter-2, CPA2 family [Desulfacinum infernum DSM 9756]